MKRIVIDIDCISRVFNKSNIEHAEYKPIYDGVVNHQSLKIAYGGATYCKELAKASTYRKLFSELVTASKAIPVDSGNVNQYEEVLKKDTEDKGFNDQHIIAIVVVGKCKIICSHDSTSYPFFQDPNLYPKRFKRPKIYNGLGSRSILN